MPGLWTSLKKDEQSEQMSINTSALVNPKLLITVENEDAVRTRGSYNNTVVAELRAARERVFVNAVMIMYTRSYFIIFPDNPTAHVALAFYGRLQYGEAS
ncbi:hypothetical protein TWF970_000745 [Orbilia oligospora]|uniref:Uncharacterized protein n=1 Tax=Orbilia oligospora TaxID=2813651 RepID=A0A7C8VKS7_ORBOL|nr:hypothetical protein TWF970_000745 [Orbilia oligospora]